MMEFIPDWLVQLFLVVIAVGLTQGFKLLFNKFQFSDIVKRWIVMGVSMLLSLVAALVYAAPVLPPFAGDPGAWFFAAVNVLAPWFVGVQAVYNFVLRALFEKLGWQ